MKRSPASLPRTPGKLPWGHVNIWTSLLPWMSTNDRHQSQPGEWTRTNSCRLSKWFVHCVCKHNSSLPAQVTAHCTVGLSPGLVGGLSLWALSKETRMDPVSCLKVLTTSLSALLLVTSELQGLAKRYSFQSSAPHPETDHPNYRLDLERYTIRACWSPWCFHVPTEQKQREDQWSLSKKRGKRIFHKEFDGWLDLRKTPLY